MKKILLFIISLAFCFSFCGCAEVEDSARTNELSEKYDFYSSSISRIKVETDLGNTAANDIFILLVDNIGIDSYFSISEKDDYYKINYGLLHDYKMYLDNGVVSSIYDGDKQLYPATASDDTEEVAENTEEATTETVQNNIFDFSVSDFPAGEVDTGDLKLQHGELLSVIFNDGVVVVKAKITPSMTNKLTVDQNYYNVADLIKEHGFDTCNELQYWAVADMSDGDESKVVSFTLNKDVITSVFNGNIVDNQIGKNASDLWVLPSLQ
jgi:hypothetical protein